MSEQANQTTSAVPHTDSWIVDGLKKQTVTLIVAAVWAFYTFIWNSHDSEKDLKYQVEATAKAVEQIKLDNKEQSETQNQFLIVVTKLSESQNRLAQDVKDVQIQQQRNTEMLFNRK